MLPILGSSWSVNYKMNHQKHYDIFISYRREGGFPTAQLLHDRLTKYGYRVFLDLEALPSGKFNEKLYSVIEECTDFIIVLSKGSADRCCDENDWMRLEAAHAVKLNKNVIPVIDRDFKFPDELPADIAVLPDYHHIETSHELFQEVIAKLRRNFLRAPTYKQHLISKALHSPLFWGIAVCLSAVLAWGSYYLYQKEVKHVYPMNRTEENNTQAMLAYLMTNLQLINHQCELYKDALDDFESHLRDQSSVSFQKFATRCTFASGKIREYTKMKKEAPADLIAALTDSPIDLGDLQAMPMMVEAFDMDLRDTLKALPVIFAPDGVFNREDKTQVLDKYRKLLSYNIRVLYYSLCHLLAPVDDEFLDKFLADKIPLLTFLTDEHLSWTHDPVAAKREVDASFEKQKAIISELAAFTGEAFKSLRDAQQTQAAMMKNAGFSPEQIKKLQDAQGRISAKETHLQILKQQVEDRKAENQALLDVIRKKNAVTPDDSPGLIWGKAQLLLRAGLIDEAVAALQAYMLRETPNDPNAEIYIPAAIALIRRAAQTGIDCGALVMGYEPGKPPHDTLKIGDIIIGYNGEPVRNVDEYFEMRKDTPGAATATVMRLNSEGKFDRVECALDAKGTKVGLLPINEKE